MEWITKPETEQTQHSIKKEEKEYMSRKSPTQMCSILCHGFAQGKA